MAESPATEHQNIFAQDAKPFKATLAITADTYTPDTRPEEAPIASSSKSSKDREIYGQEFTYQPASQSRRDPYRDPIVDASQTIFSSQPILFYRHSHGEVSADHKNAFLDTLARIRRYLQDHHKIGTVSQLIQFQLWMVGKSKDTARPSIVVLCRQEDSILLHKVLCSTFTEEQCNLFVHPRPRVSSIFKRVSSDKHVDLESRFHLHILAHDRSLRKLYSGPISGTDTQVALVDNSVCCGSKTTHPEIYLEAPLACILEIEKRYWGLVRVHRSRDVLSQLDTRGPSPSTLAVDGIGDEDSSALDWILVPVPHVDCSNPAISSIVRETVLDYDADEDRYVLTLYPSTDTPQIGFLVCDTPYCSTTASSTAIASWTVELDDAQGWSSSPFLSNETD